VNRRGSGTLADVTTVQRINSHGGAAQGACDQAGAFRASPIQQITFSSARTNNPLSGVPGNLRGAAMQAVDALCPLRGWMP
jgi:hypothetical protein